MTIARALVLGFVWIAAVSMALFWAGCKEKSATEPETVEPITEDLFPLIVGRQLVFSGFLRDAVTDVNIQATGAVYEARMTVVGVSVTTPFGSAHVISDSQRVPTGLPSPPTAWVTQSFYVQRAQPTGNANGCPSSGRAQAG